MGLSLVESALIFEALGRTPLGLYAFGCKAPDAGNIEILHKYATPEQTKKWLHPLVAGDIRSCFSMTEVDMPGSNPVMMDTTAVKDGDDYVINGHKWYTSSADGAARQRAQGCFKVRGVSIPRCERLTGAPCRIGGCGTPQSSQETMQQP